MRRRLSRVRQVVFGYVGGVQPRQEELARARVGRPRGVYVPEAATRLLEWEEDVMRVLVIGLHNRTEAAPGRSVHTIVTLGVTNT